MTLPASGYGNTGYGSATSGGGSGFFSDAAPVVTDNTEESGTVFSDILGNIGEGVEAASGVVREAIPVFTAQYIREQSEDQLRNPTFDQRNAGMRFDQGTTTADDTGQPRARPAVMSSFPNLSSGAMMFSAALIGVVLIAVLKD